MAWAGLLLGGIILLCVNLIASIGFKNVKSDLTEDGLFTISSGTREILQTLDEPLTARLYFSKRLGDLAPDQAR